MASAMERRQASLSNYNRPNTSDTAPHTTHDDTCSPRTQGGKAGTSAAADGSGKGEVAERLTLIEAMQARSDMRLDRIESMLSSMHDVVMRGCGGGGGEGEAKAAPAEGRWEEGDKDKKEDAGHEGKLLVVPTVADVVVFPRAPRLDS